MFSIPDLTIMGSLAANFSKPISSTTQTLLSQLWPAFIVPLDFRDLIIFFVAVSAAVIGFHLLVKVVLNLKRMTRSRKHLGDCRDFSNDPDDAFAEELQFQEALLASLSTAPSINGASSSVQGGPFSDSFCEICFENKEKWQMFKNDRCSHSFCFECTSKHIVARIEANTEEIGCPGINCSALLDADACRLLVPNETLARWDEAVCQLMYLDSQKLYCPFRDCSAMLVNDTGEAMTKSTCPLCKRSFCAACQVPWHSEFTCKEFQKLNAKGGKEEAMVIKLAKKKNWQKCPQCKMLVEKSEGCNHMTCRCKYEFCYRCGGKWSSAHGVCQQQSTVTMLQ